MCMISLHVHIVVPQTDQTRRTARPRPHIPPSRCTACPCRTQATPRPATVCFSHPHAVSEASPHTPSAAPGRHSVTVGAGNDGEAPNSAADGACDVFDSQCRRYHALALKATNIMKLLDLPWFRTECDHTLRTRLGAGLHSRDCFDLVSTYLLALKTR